MKRAAGSTAILTSGKGKNDTGSIPDKKGICKMIVKESIAGWSREQWEADRQKRRTIGGSDAGAILGLNKYKSAYALWAEKCGKVPCHDLSDSEAVRLGVDLEHYVAERWMERTGKKLRNDNHIISNTDYPWAHANIDRKVVGENAGFEAKTTSSWEVLDQCRHGMFPDSWMAQIVHYMMVTGAQCWYLGVICFGHGFFDFKIERDEEDIVALAGIERTFYGCILDDVPPSVDGSNSTSDAIRTIFADSEPDTKIDLLPVQNDVNIIKNATAAIKELEEAKEAAEQRIQVYMGSCEKGTLDELNCSISWKTQAGRSTFDRAAFEKDFGPIHPKYYKAGKPSRPFKVTFKKEK